MSAVKRNPFKLSFESEDDFNTFVLVSIILHLSLFFGFAVKNLIFPSETFVVPDSIRVDVVALPDKLPEKLETPAPPAPAPAKPEPKIEEPAKVKPPPPPPKPTAKPEAKKENIKDQEKKALEKLSAMDAIQKMQQDIDAQKKKAEAEKKPAAPAMTFKGNVITTGNSFSGLSKLRVNGYLDELKAKIREHWVLPQWLGDANLKAKVSMSISGDGSISRSAISASSGNSVFDATCLAAVNEAAPFSPPPPEIKDANVEMHFPVD